MVGSARCTVKRRERRKTKWNPVRPAGLNNALDAGSVMALRHQHVVDRSAAQRRFHGVNAAQG